MKLEGIGESELLRRILPYLTTSGYAVVAGADDAAVWPSLDPDYPEDYVVASCDSSVEGVHFDLSWMSPADAGHRALALALGDLAAKGAHPKYALVALAAPRSWSVDTVTGLYEGIRRLADRADDGDAHHEAEASRRLLRRNRRRSHHYRRHLRRRAQHELAQHIGDGFQARASYRYRDAFQGEVIALFSNPGFPQILADKQLDAQVGYTFQPGSIIIGPRSSRFHSA